MTREELSILRKDILDKIHYTKDRRTYYQECKYLEKVEREINRRNKNAIYEKKEHSKRKI